MQKKLKLVRALRSGSYDGHRRRVGAEFVVAADAKEGWFVDIGPAPQDAELPVQLLTGQSPRGKSFVEVMEQLGKPQAPQVAPQEQTLAEAASALPVMATPASDESIV